VKPGSLVKLRKRTQLITGETLERDTVGMLLGRTYLAYNPDDIRWTILIKGMVRNCIQSEIKKVEIADESR